MISAQEQALRNFKLATGSTWSSAAKALGITERAIMSYVASPSSKGYREMPTEVWQKLENLTGHELIRNGEGLYFPRKKIISISSQRVAWVKQQLLQLLHLSLPTWAIRHL